MGTQVDAAGLQALQIELLHLVWRGLQDHLELLVLEETVRVLAEASVGGPPRRLHVGDAPRLGAEHAQKRFGVHRSRAHLDVERLLEETTPGGPELGELEDELLKRDHGKGRPPATAAAASP